MPDVALMIQSGFTPRKQWIERHFRVELQEKSEETAKPTQEEATTFDPESDEDIYGQIFGDETEQPTPEGPIKTEPFGNEGVTEDETVQMDDKG
jgi:hypothetical protein